MLIPERLNRQRLSEQHQFSQNKPATATLDLYMAAVWLGVGKHFGVGSNKYVM